LRAVSAPDVVLAAAVLAALVAWIAIHTIGKRAFERRVSIRLPVGRDGVILGAEPIDLPSSVPGAPAALLLHGFGDTPQTLAYLATSLHEHGWSVRVPLLPGHGRTIDAWARTGAADWLGFARRELDAIRRSHETVALVGLSMGAALATVLAAEISTRERPAPAAAREGDPSAAPTGAVRGLVLLAPYFVLPRWVRWAAALHPIVRTVMPYVSARGSVSILDPAERARSLAYGATTLRLLHELGRAARRAWSALPQVTVPTLIVQSHADNRTTPAVAEGAVARVAAAEKQLVWIDDGGHVITVDRGRTAVAACVNAWLDAHARSAARPRKVRPA
jgi:carboxylesterase